MTDTPRLTFDVAIVPPLGPDVLAARLYVDGLQTGTCESCGRDEPDVAFRRIAEWKLLCAFCSTPCETGCGAPTLDREMLTCLPCQRMFDDAIAAKGLRSLSFKAIEAADAMLTFDAAMRRFDSRLRYLWNEVADEHAIDELADAVLARVDALQEFEPPFPEPARHEQHGPHPERCICAASITACDPDLCLCYTSPPVYTDAEVIAALADAEGARFVQPPDYPPGTPRYVATAAGTRLTRVGPGLWREDPPL